MGILVPEDFDLSTLDEAERRVVDALVHGLTDGWLVLPDVGIHTAQRDHQLDVVIVHPDLGVADIEVKGHRPTIVAGQWHAHGKRMETQPPAQAQKNAYALRDHLRRSDPRLARVEVEYGIALPNAAEVLGTLPPELHPAQVLTAPDLDDIGEAVADLLATRSRNQAIGDEAVGTILEILRPDVEISWDPTARQTRTRTRLDALCGEQVRALQGLDANRRVVVTGGVGTGKTRLALTWAGRALVRGERVLLTCYNEPLAEHVAARFALEDDDAEADDGVGASVSDKGADVDPDILVGPFLRVALGLVGVEEIPADADQRWWTETAIGEIVSRWHQVTDRFDTIIVDEGQDFSPAWLGLLESLLDPDGAQRMLVVADPRQDLYTRGFRLPSPDDGWTRAELTVNCRNAHPIAAMLRRRLDGPPAPGVAPEGLGITWVAAEDLASTQAAVDDRLAALLAAGRVPRQVAVLTTTSHVRDALVGRGPLVRWEQRGEGGILCENVHRVKGLEMDSVVLVVGESDVADALLAGGASRAVSELVLVAPAAVAARLGLA